MSDKFHHTLIGLMATPTRTLAAMLIAERRRSDAVRETANAYFLSWRIQNSRNTALEIDNQSLIARVEAAERRAHFYALALLSLAGAIAIAAEAAVLFAAI